MTTDTHAAITAAVAERTRLVGIAEATTGRKRAAAWRAVAAAEQAVRDATSNHERAIRASMPGAAERDIQAAVNA